MEQAEYTWTYQAEERHWWFVNRRRLAKALIEQQLTPGSNQFILDVGCGPGSQMDFLASWGHVIGLDFSPLALNLARHRNPSGLVQGSGLALPYLNNTFNLVTAFDVLYHRWIIDDKQAIDECYRVLQPGGWFLSTNPALPALWSVHDEIYYTRERYMVGEIRQKLVKAGFRLHVSSYTNTLLLPVMVAARLIARWLPSTRHIDRYSPPAWLNQRLIDIHNLEIKQLRRGGTLPLGSSLICLAQKPSGEEQISK